MNKNFYKTIFSKTRGEMIVVAENISAEGQTSNSKKNQVDIKIDATSTKNVSLKVLSFSIMLITGLAVLNTTLDQAQPYIFQAILLSKN